VINGSGHVSDSQGQSNATDTTQRPLMFADELMMMREGKQVVLVDNFNVIPAYKVPWFENPELARLGHNLHAEQRQAASAATSGTPPSHAPEPV
jgi:type IV secretory pathway TraG/TraD family ATPase VirD4